jgi:uncharacterized membrane protein YvbJ
MFCTKCGKKLNLAATLCPKCGEPIDQEPLKASRPKEFTLAKPIKFKNNTLIGIVIFLVIVVGGSMAITKYNSKPEQGIQVMTFERVRQ